MSLLDLSDRAEGKQPPRVHIASYSAIRNVYLGPRRRGRRRRRSIFHSAQVLPIKAGGAISSSIGWILSHALSLSPQWGRKGRGSADPPLVRRKTRRPSPSLLHHGVQLSDVLKTCGTNLSKLCVFFLLLLFMEASGDEVASAGVQSTCLSVY